MRMLISNDDEIYSPGIAVLADVATSPTLLNTSSGNLAGSVVFTKSLVPAKLNSREIVLAESLLLLLAVLLLALLLCIPIIVLTNHVKRAATILASVPYSQSSAVETIPQLDIQGPGALEEAPPLAQPQRGGVALDREKQV